MFHATYSGTTESTDGSAKQNRLCLASFALADRTPFFIIEIPCNNQEGITTRPMLLAGLTEVQLAMASIGESLEEVSLSMIFYHDKMENCGWQCQRVASVWYSEYNNCGNTYSSIRVNLYNEAIIYMMDTKPDDPSSVEWVQFI